MAKSDQWNYELAKLKLALHVCHYTNIKSVHFDFSSKVWWGRTLQCLAGTITIHSFITF